MVRPRVTMEDRRLDGDLRDREQMATSVFHHDESRHHMIPPGARVASPPGDARRL
jgi:hypothetical protein